MSTPPKAKELAAQVPLNIGHVMLRNVIKEQIDRRGPDEIRTVLQEQYGEQVWNSEQLLDMFEVSHFEPPYVHVIRKVDGVRGTVAFNDDPRFYFAFRPEGFLE
ncbi:MAG: hypothetical protein EBZ75_15330 [Oxalobacteraceae bacterium]|nr:hypothetical protein [Oxalobacteraceae bacterium]